MRRFIENKWPILGLFAAVIIAGSTFLAFLLIPQITEAAERPKAADIENGYLIIGTYLIHKDALNPTNLVAAKKTMGKSGQGIYYKSEFADGEWINIENAADVSVLFKKTGKIVAGDVIDKLTLTVWVDPTGQMISVMAPGEIEKEIASLKKDIENLEEENEEQVEDNKQTESAMTQLKIEEAKAMIAFLEALGEGNPSKAAKQLALATSPEALVAAMPDTQAAADAGLASSAGDAEKAVEALTEQADKEKSQVESKKEEVAANQSEIDKLKQDLNAAKQAGDSGTAAELQNKLTRAEAKQDELNQALKEAEAKLAATAKKLEAAGKAGQSAQSPEAVKAGLQADIAALAQEKAVLTQEYKKVEASGVQKLIEEAAQALLAVETELQKAKVEMAEAVKAALLVQQTKLQDELAQAPKQAEAVAPLLIALAEVDAQLEALNSGLDDKIEQLKEAKQITEVQLDEALDEGDTDLSNPLLEVLATIEKQLVIAEKEKLFMKKRSLEQKKAEAQADPELADTLQKQANDTIELIKALEKQKYTDKELAAIDELGAIMQADAEAQLKESGTDAGVGDGKGADNGTGTDAGAETGTVKVLPVENVISEEVDIKFEVPPMMIEGNAFIHIRPVSEAFGALVIWDDETQTVTVSQENVVVVCTINEKTAYINGMPVQLDTAPKLVAQKTIVPLKFVAESLGLTTVWHEPTQAIEISGFTQKEE